MTRSSVSIVDYGIGNLKSVENMLVRAGADVVFARTADDVMQADRLILPGVGAFDSCRRALGQVVGLESALHQAIGRGTPLLGICVGMQLLASSSDEGVLPGLGIIPGRVRRLSLEGLASGRPLRVPHMGWSSVEPVGLATLFRNGLDSVNRFYFVHSYYFDCENAEDTAGVAHYGVRFAAAVEHGNVYGVQFHPEKSHRYGMRLLRNFADLTVEAAND
ncbi:MAG: imidazole glycerol phosphate synthase subunit HisH [Steroidobacteraceae bacterium]